MGFSPEEVEILHYPLPRYTLSEASPVHIAEVRRRLGIEPEAPVIGTVTRFFPSKGIVHLIDALPAVFERHPAARVVLVGQGPQEADLRRRCSDLGISERVVFAGFQRDVCAHVGTFTVSVIPSIEEGFGLVALEAQALGVPVVASRTGGLPDIVEDGVTGVLVDPAAPAQLSEAISSLLEDGERRARMAKAARRRARRFSIDSYASRLTDIYLNLSAQHGKGLDRAG
jgi:glycosyltransferase involved in cell wall biosynthesis